MPLIIESLKGVWNSQYSDIDLNKIFDSVTLIVWTLMGIFNYFVTFYKPIETRIAD